MYNLYVRNMLISYLYNKFLESIFQAWKVKTCLKLPYNRKTLKYFSINSYKNNGRLSCNEGANLLLDRGCTLSLQCRTIKCKYLSIVQLIKLFQSRMQNHFQSYVRIKVWETCYSSQREENWQTHFLTFDSSKLCLWPFWRSPLFGKECF